MTAMLQNNELLNRMEILFPNEPRFSDLRRAYIDRDMSSLFRLLVEYHGPDIDEIRKITVEKNLHSLFRLTDGEWTLNIAPYNSDVLEPGDLRKFVLEDNTWSLYRLLLDIKDTQIIHAVKSLHANSIEFDTDSMSQGQLRSKRWLVDELGKVTNSLGTVFLCAGWYGILATMLFEEGFDIQCIRSFDIDPGVTPIAEKFNLPWVKQDWKFKTVTQDIHNINFKKHTWQAWSNTNQRHSKPITDIPDTVINTSCEHIENFSKWYRKLPRKKLLILQSNNFLDINEHINVSSTLAEFSEITPMKTVLFSGQLELENYSRFMRIGYK